MAGGLPDFWTISSFHTEPLPLVMKWNEPHHPQNRFLQPKDAYILGKMKSSLSPTIRFWILVGCFFCFGLSLGECFLHFPRKTHHLFIHDFQRKSLLIISKNRSWRSFKKLSVASVFWTAKMSCKLQGLLYLREPQHTPPAYTLKHSQPTGKWKEFYS